MSDQILYAFGAGRDPQTKAARRLDRFSEKTFRIGPDVIIRAGRRTEVAVSYIRDHLDTVIGHIERGALRLQSHSDSFIDPNELRALVNGETLPVVVQGPGEGEETSEEVSEESPPSEEPTQPPEPAQDEDKSDEELAGEPDPEPVDLPADEPIELADMSADLPAVLDTPEPLPEGWRSRSKKGLLALAQERKLEVTDKMSNRDLIAELEKLETR